MEKISPTHKFILEIQQILEFYDLKAHTITITVTFNLPEYVRAWKKQLNSSIHP